VSVRVRSAVRPAAFDGANGENPFRRFFEGNPFGQSERDRSRGPRRDGRRGRANPGMSQGSGFFVSEDGYIVTNNHVVANGSEFTVVMNDGAEMEAKLIGTDPKTDLAVLKVDADNQTYVSFSDAKSRVGEWVVAVGNPFGLGGTVTAGIVSGMNRDIGSGPYDDFLQIDAAVNKGNSGGPAFDLSGEVIGVNTAIFSPSGGNVGIAFAISAKSASEVVSDLIDKGSVTRGWLGVQIQPVTKDIAASLDLDGTDGAIVAEAQTDSPAERAGLKAGDVILSVGDKPVDGPRELARLIADVEPGEVVQVRVVRNGEERVINVELGKLPGAEKQAANVTPKVDKAAVELAQLGLTVRDTPAGVVISDVSSNGVAASKGLSEGDKIESVNGRPISDVNAVGAALASAMADERRAILLQVRSGDRNRFVALPLEAAS
ncbi:MAG: trypsin-like peptidase domain-containing protein, partial [Pseudomonadota bacterium]